MRSRHGVFNCRVLTLGSVNLALVSLYFIPAWGREAVQVLISPIHGLEHRAHAAATIYIGDLFDLGFTGLAATSSMLAGIKLVIAAAFTAYIIEFARSWMMGREADQETVDTVLILAAVGIAICALPAALGEPALSRASATQTLLVAGAIMVVVVERRAAAATARATDDVSDSAMPLGSLTPASSQPALAAVARVPDTRARGV